MKTIKVTLKADVVIGNWPAERKGTSIEELTEMYKDELKVKDCNLVTDIFESLDISNFHFEVIDDNTYGEGLINSLGGLL